MRTVGLCICFFGTVFGSSLKEQKDWIYHSIEGVIRSVDPTALVGVKVVSLDKGVVLYERNAQCRFVPASSLKLFTAAAALEQLGADDRFETMVKVDGVIDKGVVKGNCYLVGSGDPSLKGTDFIGLVEGMDVREIQGDLILDMSCFEDGPMGPGWMWDEEPGYWCVPLSALNVEHNFVGGAVVTQPELLAATLFKELLDRKGILLRGELKLGRAPEGSVCLTRHFSEPMSELIKVVLQNTDNLYSNCIFKRMGGSWEKGRKSVESFMRDVIGLDVEKMRIVDGSGLSRYNLASPDQMMTFLKRMHSNRFLKTALPVGGEVGTLKRRMLSFRGRVAAKTGSMTGVSSLCGFVTTETGEELAVAIFVNGYMKEGREIKVKLEDEICHILINRIP